MKKSSFYVGYSHKDRPSLPCIINQKVQKESKSLASYLDNWREYRLTLIYYYIITKCVSEFSALILKPM